MILFLLQLEQQGFAASLLAFEVLPTSPTRSTLGDVLHWSFGIFDRPLLPLKFLWLHVFASVPVLTAARRHLKEQEQELTRLDLNVVVGGQNYFPSETF